MHHTEGRLMRRQRQQGSTSSAPYRLNTKQVTTLVTALASWQQECRRRFMTYTDAARLRDYTLECADIKCIAGSLPRHVPYDVSVTPTEWDVISRALRYYYRADRVAHTYANSMLITWRRHIRFPPR